ncbi:hypothetical protein B4088_5362 [Bacillus cereus]|uniref:Uncharacterized protein n=1 Tax=Bacillus cereus TaxID=1396 RepID=A0A164LAX0_BACCE|nr:hypothetical protein B4088_5362 [Bacillus cereus]
MRTNKVYISQKCSIVVNTSVSRRFFNIIKAKREGGIV